MSVFNPYASRILTGLTGTLVGAMICFGATASPADARAIDQVAVTTAAPAIKVSYADLDLTSPTGRIELNRRINHAAHEVCTSEITGSRIGTTSASRECVRLAIVSAPLPAPRTMTGSLDEKRKGVN